MWRRSRAERGGFWGTHARAHGEPGERRGILKEDVARVGEQPQMVRGVCGGVVASVVPAPPTGLCLAGGWPSGPPSIPASGRVSSRLWAAPWSLVSAGAAFYKFLPLGRE